MLMWQTCIIWRDYIVTMQVSKLIYTFLKSTISRTPCTSNPSTMKMVKGHTINNEWPPRELLKYKTIQRIYSEFQAWQRISNRFVLRCRCRWQRDLTFSSKNTLYLPWARSGWSSSPPSGCWWGWSLVRSVNVSPVSSVSKLYLLCTGPHQASLKQHLAIKSENKPKGLKVAKRRPNGW